MKDLFKWIPNIKRYGRLANGQKVKEGDLVAFINSDGERCEDVIRKRKDGTLYFWNCNFEITDYKSAYRVDARVS